MDLQICHTALLFLLVATSACMNLSDHPESCAVADDEGSKAASMLQTRQHAIVISMNSGEAAGVVPNPVTSFISDDGGRPTLEQTTVAPDPEALPQLKNDGGSPACDWQCYLDRYPDLQKVLGPSNTAAAARHYQAAGKRAGRKCTCKDEAPACNWQCYLDRYPDLQKAYGPSNTAAAARHWSAAGEKAGRKCTCKAPLSPSPPTLMCNPLPQVTGLDVSGCNNVRAGSKCSVPCPNTQTGLAAEFLCCKADAEAGRHPTIIEETQGTTNLLQRASQQRLGARQWVHAGLHFFSPQLAHWSLLTYFKRWVHGRFSKKVFLEVPHSPQQSLLDEQSRLQSTNMVAATMELLRSRRYKECPELVITPEAEMSLQLVQDEVVDRVQHALYVDAHGLLQHVAARLSNNGSVFDPTFDPPACQKPQSPAPSMNTLLQGLQDDLSIAPVKLTGEMELLALDDELVKDCVKLFHRTAEENCERDMALQVVSARSFVINGLAVQLEAKVCSTQGACFVHHPTCAFQVPPSPDASLLQHGPNEDVVPEEDEGLTATVVMHTHICLADQKDGVDSTARQEVSLMERFGMGELSRYKGFEHVNDPFPKWGALDVGDLPGDIDFRTKYSNCFPSKGNLGPGTEIIRDQGICGSCWVFTTASAAMNNICISGGGAHSLRSADDRFEISAQKIMSCPAEGQGNQYGCGGGNMLQFDRGARYWGLTREVDNRFQCGGGNPLHHFDEVDQSCSSFPWGSYCYGAPDKNWFWGGAASVSGEYSMMTYVSQGLSLYASFDTYPNFLQLKGDSIYSSTTGEKKGGHAVTVIGYGTQSGSKYWHVQNSWGVYWGTNGFAKFLRGANLAGIEDGAFVVRAWAKGSSEPPCMDSDKSSISGSQGDIPCSEVKGGDYGNICEHAEVGVTARLQCPYTCGTCVASSGADAKPSLPPGASPPTGAPGTAPTTEMGLCISSIKSLLSGGGSGR